MDPKAAKWLLRGLAHTAVNFTFGFIEYVSGFPLKICANFYVATIAAAICFIAAFHFQLEAASREAEAK